jgi:hypothetical protein
MDKFTSQSPEVLKMENRMLRAAVKAQLDSLKQLHESAEKRIHSDDLHTKGIAQGIQIVTDTSILVLEDILKRGY